MGSEEVLEGSEEVLQAVDAQPGADHDGMGPRGSLRAREAGVELGHGMKRSGVQST